MRSKHICNVSMKRVARTGFLLSIFSLPLYSWADTENSTQKENSWWDTAKQKAGEFANDGGKQFDSLTQTVKTHWQSTRKFSQQKVEDALNNLSDTSAQLNQAGFDLARIYVDISLVPGAVLHVVQIKELSDEEKQGLFNKYNHDHLMSFMLKSLFNAYDLQVNGYEVTSVRIYLSVNPKAVAVLERNVLEDL